MTNAGKIVISPSFFYRFDPKQWRAQKPYPPYGTLIAAAVLREAGYPVHFFDTHLRQSTTELEDILAKERPRYLIIYDDGFNYLTKMCLTAMRIAAFELLALGKKFLCRTIVCNSDSTDHYQAYLDHGADFVVLGEGEITLRELIQVLEDNQDPGTVPGLAFQKSGQYMITPKRPIWTDLDTFPDPAWDLADLEAYRSIWLKNHGYFSLNIATTRGCPFKCNWCAKPIYGNRYHSRSPQRVVQEIHQLVHKYGVQHIWMADDIFGLKPQWVSTFRTLMDETKPGIKYMIQSRADLLLKENQLEDLVHSGLETVWIGAESGSQKILDAMDKGITLGQIAQATTLLKARGVKVGFFLQFGYLDETAADIQATLDLVATLIPDDIGVSISYPLPGTGFYDKIKHQLGTKQNWADSDDLDLMYRGHFSAAFYKKLHRYVHKSFRLKQLVARLFAQGWFKVLMQPANWIHVGAFCYYLVARWLDRYRLYGLSKRQFLPQ